MPTIILASSTDSITLYGDDPYASGFTYRNDTLTSWYELPDVDASIEARPNDFGAFGWERVYAGAAKPQISGTFFGSSRFDAAVARNRLTGLYSSGTPITMTVIDERGTYSRSVNVVAATVPWDPTAVFEFTLGTVAVDPRRYGVTTTTSTGIPASASGLTWPLGTASSGRFFDWGVAGNSGTVTFTNTGNAQTLPTIFVSGGSIATGFRVVEVETARELTYLYPVGSGETVSLDARTKSVTVNGTGSYTPRLSSRRWPSIPAKATRTYAFIPLGATSGTPTMSVAAATADL